MLSLHLWSNRSRKLASAVMQWVLNACALAGSDAEMGKPSYQVGNCRCPVPFYWREINAVGDLFLGHNNSYTIHIQ